MRIRIKTKWSKEEREVSVEDSVGVLAFNAWKIGMQVLLEIENENFQTDTQMQRIAIMEEVMALMIHSLDRMVYHTVDDDDRAHLITMYAKKIADHIQDNARDFDGPGDYRSPFITKLNERMADYAETSWNDEKIEPNFNMSRLFAGHIAETLGPRDRKWVMDYIQQVLTPDFMTLYKKAIRSIGLIETDPDEELSNLSKHHMLKS
ncbi:MAG: hypothetical protein KAH22_11165 [Thiotrichaceae bacterium]|nr:hypothetical protein [Thiotrichaceae bacterium]